MNRERRHLLKGALFVALLPKAASTSTASTSQPENHITELKPFNCTIRIFDASDGKTLEEHVLPVDSPDVEHAIASTLANAASFTKKAGSNLTVKPVAFMCTRVEARS